MRGRLVLLLIGSLLALSSASPAASQAPRNPGSPLHLDIRERVLDNGLTVLVWERPSAGRIGARVFYRVDVAAERPGTAGLTHMLEHYLFMGSHRVGTSDWEAERPFAEAVERIERDITDERNRNRSCFLQREVFAEVEVECTTPRLDSLQAALDQAFEAQQRFASGTDFDWIYQPAGGTGLTASTGRDWMKFDIDLPSSALELFMWMERSRVENPVFRFFEPEREVVVDQIRRADNRPDGPFQRVLRSMTYDAHPYGWAHWFSDLTRATREDHWEIFYRYFIPQNTILVIAGDVEADEVFRQAERYWGSWLPGRPSPRLRTVEPAPVGEKRLQAEAAAGPSVIVQVPMPAVGHPDAPVFEVLAELLGGSRGLLERELVEERGIATSTEASSWLAKYPSHFTVRADARSNDDLEEVEAAMESVLHGIASDGIDPDLVEAAVDRMVLAMARGLERVGPSAVRIGAMESIFGWRHLNEQPTLWAAVTPADLARVVERYFPRSMRTVGVLRRTREEPPGLATRAGPVGSRGEEGIPGGPIEEWAEGGGDVRSWERPRGTAHAAARAGVGSSPTVSAHSPDGSAAHGATSLDRPSRGAAVPQESHLDIDPLALAEMPWYAPPWMAGRRPSRFLEPPPAEGWRELSTPDSGPVLPRAEDHRVVLPQGYRAYLVTDSLLPLVQMTALVRAGKVDEAPGREGIAELTARIVQSGSSGELDATALEERLREIGASLSVRVDDHHTRIHLLASPQAADEAARILVDMIRAPRLDEALFERERERAAVSAERALDDAGSRLRHLFHRTLFPTGHPLARRPTEASVRSIDLEEVEAFHRTHFAPERIVLAVSGRVDAAKIVDALHEGLEGRMPARGIAPPPWGDAPLDPVTGGGARVVAEGLPSRQGHVMLGHRGLSGIPDDPREHAALEVMNYVLSGGAFVSRMMELLRTDTGITSALYGSVEPGAGLPFPYVWRFSGNPETLARGVRLAVREIERMRRDGVTQEELDGARTSYLQGLIPASYETSHLTAERFAERALLGRFLYQTPGYLSYYAGDESQIDALRRLTVEDVNEAARRYLVPEELVIAVVGPLDEIRAGASEEDLPFVTPL